MWEVILQQLLERRNLQSETVVVRPVDEHCIGGRDGKRAAPDQFHDDVLCPYDVDRASGDPDLL